MLGIKILEVLRYSLTFKNACMSTVSFYTVKKKESSGLAVAYMSLN